MLQVCGWSHRQGAYSHIRADAVESLQRKCFPEAGGHRRSSGGSHYGQNHFKNHIEVFYFLWRWLTLCCFHRETRSTSPSSSSSSREISSKTESRRSVRGQCLTNFNLMKRSEQPDTNLFFFTCVKVQSYSLPVSRNPPGEERNAGRSQRTNWGFTNGKQPQSLTPPSMLCWLINADVNKKNTRTG